MLKNSKNYKQLAVHGLEFLQNYQRDQEHGGYYWILKCQNIEDSTKHAYGHAFALLAASTAYKAGIGYAGKIIEEIFDVLELHFWKEQDGLYVDEISKDWQSASPYRGQNGNMHMSEAMIAAFEDTGNKRYLNIAHRIAHSVMFKLLPQSGNLIWEPKFISHFHWYIAPSRLEVGDFFRRSTNRCNDDSGKVESVLTGVAVDHIQLNIKEEKADHVRIAQIVFLKVFQFHIGEK